MATNITIGSSLQALQHAYQNKNKLVLNCLGFPNKFAPLHDKLAWGLLYTKLILDGSMIGGDSVKKIKINEKTLQVVCDYNITNEVEYAKLFIFDDKNVINLPDVLKEVDEYIAIDVLQPISLISNIVNKTLLSDDSLVKELHIYKKTETSPIEIFSVSYLTKKQLTNFDYSDTMVKFKSEELLRENNFLGIYARGNSPRASIELEVVKRIIKKKMDIYENTDKIEFFYGRV